MSKNLNCKDPKFLGEGGEGIIVLCIDDFNKKYAVKLAEPNTEQQPNCTLIKELENGKYINSSILEKPILLLKTTNKFGKTKTKYSQENKYIGQENLIKYYDLDVIGLTGENVQDIKTSAISRLDKDIENAKPQDKPQIIKLKQDAEQSIRDKINDALHQKCLLVVEYCDQGDLYSFIKSHPEYVSDPSLFKDMIYQIFCGLVYLYNKKVCHWDIKPENILVKTNPTYEKDKSADPRKYLFKIADYGTVLLAPIDEIKDRLHDNSQQQNKIKLMTEKEATEFIKQNMTEKSLNNTQPNINIISLINDKQINLKDTIDITYEFQSTKEYIPSSPLQLTTFYRDMYAFVLCVYMILIMHSRTNTEQSNPNAGQSNTNFPMSVLASKKKENNYIFQYYKKNTHSRQAELLWHIARIVKDIEEKIETQSEALYYIKEPNRNNGVIYYKPQKVIIDVQHEIYKELYEGIGELFETRIGKTLKKINQRKIAAQTRKATDPQQLDSQASSNNTFDIIFQVPENIERDLLGKHIVFVNSSDVRLSTNMELPSGLNMSELAWNNAN